MNLTVVQQGMPIDYNQTNLGLLPCEWDAVPLGELFIFKNGLNKAKRFFGTGAPIVNYMDVFERPGLRAEHLSGRVNLSPEEIRNFSVRLGDVFFTRTSETIEEIGVASVMLDEPCDTVFSGFVLRARPRNGRLNHCYKQYCFAPKFVRSQIVSKATYTTRALTNGRALSAVWIAVPPEPEQRAIAEVLSDVDGLIGVLDALIAKKQAIKQAVMQQLLTGETRLPGFSGAWETQRLGNIASFFKGSGVLLKTDLTLDGRRRCIHYGELFTTYRECIRIVVHGTNREGLFSCSLRNDVLMPASDVTPNGLATASCILDSDIILGGDILVIRVPTGVLNGVFLAYSIKINRNQVMRLVSGTTVFHLYGRDMANFCFAAPSLREQNAIVRVLADMDAEIDGLERRLDKMRGIKQGMMQQLLTGRVRLVRPDVGPKAIRQSKAKLRTPCYHVLNPSRMDGLYLNTRKRQKKGQEMNANDVMRKYSMSVDDVLNVRAIYGGTVSIVPNELLDEILGRYALSVPQSTPTQVYEEVQFKSVDDSDYNRAMGLFLMLPAEELRAIL